MIISDILDSLDRTGAKFARIQALDMYTEVTQTSGPSKPLLDFVLTVHDLNSVVGLSSLGLESLSSESQHDIVIKSVDRAVLYSGALESLSDDIKSAHKALDGSSNNSLSAVKKSLGFMGTLSKVAAKLTYVGKVVPYTVFENIVKTHRELYKVEADFCTHIPRSDHHDEWVNFYALLTNHYRDIVSDIRQRNSELVNAADGTRYELTKSGWTAERLASESKTLLNFIEQLVDIKSKFAAQLKGIESWVEDERARISKKISDAHDKHTAEWLPDEHGNRQEYNKPHFHVKASEVQMPIEAAIAHHVLRFMIRSVKGLEQNIRFMENILRQVSHGFDVHARRNK